MSDRQESVPSKRGLEVFVAIGAALIVLVLAVPSPLGARLGMAGLGVLSLVLGLLKPSGFWDAPSVRDLRGLLGDRIVMLLYVTVGVAVIVWAFTTTLG